MKKIASTILVCVSSAILLTACSNHKENKNESKNDEQSVKIASEEDEHLDKESKKRSVIENPDEENATAQRTNLKTETTFNQDEYDKAAQEGEFKESIGDIEVKPGISVSEQDIANARQSIRDVGVNDQVFSDMDVAKVIKYASDSNMDVGGVAKDFLDGKIDLD